MKKRSILKQVWNGSCKNTRTLNLYYCSTDKGTERAKSEVLDRFCSVFSGNTKCEAMCVLKRCWRIHWHMSDICNSVDFC